MIVLVPRPMFTASVVVGKTIGILNIDMGNIRCIEPIFDEDSKEIERIEITYVNGGKEYIDLWFTDFMEQLIKVYAIRIPNVNAVKLANNSINKLLTSMEQEGQIKEV